MGGFQIRGMHVNLHQDVLCDGQENTQEYLRRRFVSIMEGVNWVCDDALEDIRGDSLVNWMNGTSMCGANVASWLHGSRSPSDTFSFLTQMSVADVRPIRDVNSDTVLAWMPTLAAMLDSKLDAELDGFEWKLDQALGLHQTRLDKHDAEPDSQRQLLEDLKTEIFLLRKNRTDRGRMGCDMSSDSASTVGSLTQAEWCPQNVLVRG